MRMGANSRERAALFLILHACAALAIAAHARIANTRALAIVGFAMETGAILFSGEIAIHVFAGVGAFRFAAPIGGTVMIVSWLALAAVFAFAGRRGA